MVKQLSKAMLVVFAMAAVLTACAPASAVAEQNPGQVATSVAMTVQAQAGDIAAAVAATVGAQQAAATATESPTPIALNLPATDTPFPTFTPFVVTPSSGNSGGGTTGSSVPLYSCSVREVQPRTNVFHPGDTAIKVVWVITNTGSKDWLAGKDFSYVNGPLLSSYTGQEFPAVKSGDSVTISFTAAAPLKPGYYGMQFKLEGGFCWPALNIQVVRPPDP